MVSPAAAVFWIGTACCLPSAAFDKHPLAAPGVTSLTEPTVLFRVADEHYVVLERGEVRAIIVDNAALDLPDLPGRDTGPVTMAWPR
jgi:hypothetical protein